MERKKEFQSHMTAQERETEIQHLRQQLARLEADRCVRVCVCVCVGVCVCVVCVCVCVCDDVHIMSTDVGYH